ncbi:MAG TPA: stage V sporulation protein AD [Clostridia bacterium]|jgi:stage V sporulation protein AD|nr:stage V sporulation protein AD [Clostridia bacterium]
MSGTKKVGKQTVKFTHQPKIISTASIVGPKEGEGPLGRYFDKVLTDNIYGEKSWEKAESKIFKETIELAIQKAGLTEDKIDFLLCGDLLNQTIASNFAVRDFPIPFLGLYGACSTMVEAMVLAAMLVDGGFADYVVAGASSHHDTAERQYRYPTEQGVQRPLTAQWTVTGAGVVTIATEGTGPNITYATIGQVIDLGQKDADNMGSAMAPAATDTIFQHFKDTNHSPDDYDLIITGDLGKLGKKLTQEMLKQKGLDLTGKLEDCGVLIYSDKQDVHSGGSGCGCAATVFSGYLYNQLTNKKYKRIMLVATGALLSPTSSQQGESIPSIAHAIVVENN